MTETPLKRLLFASVIAGLSSLLSLVVHAQSVPVTGAAPLDAKSAEDWRFAVAIYGWATNLSGSTTVHGNTIDINASLIDLIQKSDSIAAFDGYVEANKGPFGVYGDVVWAKLGIPASASAFRNPIGGLQLSARANAATTTSLLILEGGGVYELVKVKGGEKTYSALDVFAGVRYWNMSEQVTLDVTGAVNFSDPRLAGFDRSRSVVVADSGSLQWVDPLIGLRVRHQITPSQHVTLRGDVGGFGIPGSSTFTWQVAATYGYTWQFTGYSLSAVGGYRALSINKSFDAGPTGTGLALILHGPLIGLVVRF